MFFNLPPTVFLGQPEKRDADGTCREQDGWGRGRTRRTVKRPIALTFAAVLVCGAIRPAVADPAIDLSAGTLGLAAGISRVLNPTTTLRFSYGTFQFGRSEEFDNVVIDVTARLRLNESFRVQNAGFYAERQLRPGLRAVGGLVVNLNAIDAVSVPADQSITIGGVVYPQNTAGGIFTRIRWNRVAPYLGIALGTTAPSRRPALFAEIGAYYQGPAQVAFDATGAILANQAKFQKYYDDERRQLTSELAPFQLYPVVQLGLRVRM